MPLLPKKNSLDYNPDALINASKKITAIALERMKNPLEDPDTNTLSTMEASKVLDESIMKMEDLAGQFSSILLRLNNISSATTLGSGRKKGGAKTKKVKPELILDEVIVGDAPDDELTPYARGEINRREFERRLAMDRNRFRGFNPDDERNSQARSDISGITYRLDDESSYAPLVDRGAYKPLLGSTGTLTDIGTLTDDSFSYGEFNPDDYGDDSSIASSRISRIGKEGKDWTSLIFYLIQLTRKMDMIVVSRIKPVIKNLSQPQIGKLNDIYIMMFNSYNDLIEPFGRRIFAGDKFKDPITKVIRNPNLNALQDYRRNFDISPYVIAKNEYGDEILNTFNTERQKLLLDLLVVINAWKQNTPSGQQVQFNEIIQKDFDKTLEKNKELYKNVERDRLENDPNVLFVGEGMVGEGRAKRRPKKKTGAMNLVGCGRNFYGEVINNSADIPTIWSNVRDCPTKYLL